MNTAHAASETVRKRPDGTPIYAVECPECGDMVVDSPDGWDAHDHAGTGESR